MKFHQVSVSTILYSLFNMLGEDLRVQVNTLIDTNIWVPSQIRSAFEIYVKIF